jgi:SAM-dependent methyltransferase
MTELHDIYTAEWFAHDFKDLQPEFSIVANAIYREFRPTTAIDIGCGPGMILERLGALGVLVSGVDGSRHAFDYASDVVKPAILVQDILTLHEIQHTEGGVVICTEVAEHLDEKDAPKLVALLASAMCPVVFTAAPPGQDGHHHVNCRPIQYWIDMFNDHGMILDGDKTRRLRDRWESLRRLSHMYYNLAVFT